MNRYMRDFVTTTEELLGSDTVRSMGQWKHHGPITTLDHSLFVAYLSYRWARFLHLDARAAARGGLLHDLYLYNSKDKSAHPGWQCFDHPRAAAKNAQALTDLSPKEKNIILSHMWPLGGALPRSPEALAGGPGGHHLRRAGGVPHLSPRQAAPPPGCDAHCGDDLILDGEEPDKTPKSGDVAGKIVLSGPV